MGGGIGMGNMSKPMAVSLQCMTKSTTIKKIIIKKKSPQFIVIHIVKGFSIVNEADVFLEFSCSFYDPANVGNLISGSSLFSKSNLNIWKFLVHVLLKPDLENFEHYFAIVK